MRWTSTLVEAAGGKVGNVVALMNRGGLCFRRWVTPSNPNTGAQQGVRGTMATLAAAWSDTLTQAQRDAWIVYAATLDYVNKLGVHYTIFGFNAFAAANAARIVAGLSQVNDAPTVGGFAGGTSPVPTFDVTANKVSVAYTNTDDWAGEAGGALTVRLCPIGFKPGIQFYEGPFLFLDLVTGAATPPTSPELMTPPFTLVEGTQYAVATRFIRADGRYSQESIFRGLGIVP